MIEFLDDDETATVKVNAAELHADASGWIEIPIGSESVVAIARAIPCPRCKRAGECMSDGGHVYSKGFMHRERRVMAGRVFVVLQAQFGGGR